MDRCFALLLTCPALTSAQATEPSWSAESDQQGAQLGAAVASAGDVDGDGFSDVLVGVHAHDGAAGIDEGRVRVHLGGPLGPAASPSWSVDGGSAGAFLGWSVACAGDVNGDGFSDVVVGAPRASAGQTREGRAQVFLGSAAGLATTPAWTFESDQAEAQLGHSVASAGDVNGDGFSDVVVSAPFFDGGEESEGRALVFLGSAAGLGASPAWSVESDQPTAWLGYSVAGAGDVNGDGFDDVLVGVRRHDGGETDEGAALVFLGSAGGLGASAAWSAESDQAGAELGGSVAGAGDVNGDGFGDVVAGAHLYDAGMSDEGAAFLWLGSASGLAPAPAWSFATDEGGAQGGFAVACAGDVNGDGRADVLVGARFHSDAQHANEGEALLFLGNAAGLDADPAWSDEGDQANALFGASLAAAGDANGDGYADVLVGAPLADHPEPNEGRALLYRGGPRLPSATANWKIEGNSSQYLLGSPRRAGDVDGDGYEDFAAGSPLFSQGSGQARLYRGSANGPLSTPAWEVTGSGAFGWAIASADVNGDGYSDLIVGEPDFAAVDVLEGRVRCFLGSPSGLATTAAWSVVGDEPVGWLGESLAAGDFDGDGFGDVIVELTDVFYGSPSGLGPNVPVPGNPTGSGYKDLGSVGDVNGDGFDDVVYGSSTGIRLLVGSPDGLRMDPTGWQSAPRRRAAIAAAGDVNGDGFADVLLGERSFAIAGQLAGRALLYLGSSAGLAATPAWTVHGTHDERLGSAVSSAGDVDGDGFGDVLVGAPEFDDDFADVGAVWLYRGTASGLASAPARTWIGSQSAEHFGARLAVADLNGDGHPDALVGASQHDAPTFNEGAIFVFAGNEGRGGLVRGLQQRRADDSAPIALGGRTDAAGAFRLRCRFPRALAGLGWLSPDAPRARLEWEVEPLGMPFDGLGVTRGPHVALAPPSGEATFDELVADMVLPTRFRRRSLAGPPADRDTFHWRVRVATDHPLFPRSAWFSPASVPRAAAMLRRR